MLRAATAWGECRCHYFFVDILLRVMLSDAAQVFPFQIPLNDPMTEPQ
jgi:hypothetical protein